jgi:hypothetical protein
MKKCFLGIILLIAIIIAGCKSTPLIPYVPVPSKKVVGGVVGKIQVTTDRTFWNMRAGVYNSNITVMVMEKKTKKIFATNSIRGTYYFYNLPPGDYYLRRWQMRIDAGNDIIVYLQSEIKDYSFTIEENTFTTIKNLDIKAQIPKEFTYKIDYIINYIDEDLNALKEIFTQRDSKGYYKDYSWRQNEVVEKKAVQISDENLVKNLIAGSDNDYYSMENMYKSGDYYLAFLLFYRIEEGLLNAIYTKNVDRNLLKTADLKEIAKKCKVEFSAEQMLFLNDLVGFDTRIKQGNVNDSFKAMFTKDYFESYLVKVNELREYLKKQLPALTD